MIEYAVRNKATGKIRLVEAHNPASALKRVAGSEYDVTIPTRAQMHELARQGVEIEPWKPADDSQPELQEGAE